MARPTTRLISRAHAVRAALEIIDTDGLERIVVGALLVEAVRPRAAHAAFTVVGPDAQPHLARALATNTHDAEAIFEQHIRALLAGVRSERETGSP